VPFTPSHAVVALAFVRTPLVPAAVAVGAMAPDLPLFVRVVVPSYGVTHDLAWLPLTVAMAFVLLIVWRAVLRPAVRELTPRWLAARLPAAWDAAPVVGVRETLGITDGRLSWARLGIVIASLALGVLSHIGWDLFTHEGRAGVALVPALADRWGPLRGFTWLQHGSSLLGLVVLGVVGIVWLTRRRPDPPTRLLPDAVRMAWWLSLPGMLVAAWVGGLAAFGPLRTGFTGAHLAYRVLPPACAAWGTAAIALCVAILVVRVRRTAPRTPR
jgi:hypothetical protein